MLSGGELGATILAFKSINILNITAVRGTQTLTKLIRSWEKIRI